MSFFYRCKIFAFNLVVGLLGAFEKNTNPSPFQLFSKKRFIHIRQLSFISLLISILFLLNAESFGQAGPVNLRGSGGTITVVNISGTDYIIHTYTTTGSTTFTPPSAVTEVEYLVVAGGAGGGGISAVNAGGAGGGGAGGLLTNVGGTGFSVTYQSYNVTVGAGGTAGTDGNRGGTGGNSVFATITASGGGGGGSTGATSGNNGGSGGGGRFGQSGGTGVAGQGYAGANGPTGAIYSAGGGGGASSAAVAPTTNTGGNGANGLSNTISGSSITYAGGGAGGGYDAAGGSGGSGGGGNSPATRGNGSNGTNNTGGGGGGATGSNGTTAHSGGTGGSGIVIIRYKAASIELTTQPSPAATSGTVLSQSPVIRILDSDGDPVTGITITVAIESGTGSITNNTATTNSNGDAIFSNMSLSADLDEVISLNFTAEGSTDKVVSNSITFSSLTNNFRTRQTGNWNDSDTWEQEYSTGDWGNTPNYPQWYEFPIVSGTASSAESNIVSSHTVALPSGIEIGDLLMVFWTDNNTAATITPPQGWTQSYSILYGSRVHAMWFKIADGSEGANITVTSSANIRSAHTSYRISKGSYSNLPIASTPAQASSTTPNPPALNPGWGALNTLWIASSHSAGANDPVSPPSDYTNIVSGYTGTIGAANARMATAHRELNTSSEDPGTFTLSSGRVWSANTVAIRPNNMPQANILNGHTVTATANVEAGNVSIENGGALIVNNNIELGIPTGASLDNDGTLTMSTATSLINGDGTFSHNSGAALVISSPEGITTSGATGNIRVAGTRTYNTGANYTYNGSSAQATGNGLTGANTLSIDNSNGLTLSVDVTVSNSLVLTNGIVTSGSSNKLTISNTSVSAISGAATNRFVSGPLVWQLASSQDYTFPVGKGSVFLPFELKSITGTAPVIEVEAYNAGSGGTPQSPLVTLSSDEHWRAETISGTYSGGVITLTRQAALGTLDAIATSTTKSGNYTTLNGTVAGNSIEDSDNTGALLGYFALAVTGEEADVSIVKSINNSTPNEGDNVVFTLTVSNAGPSDASGVEVSDLLPVGYNYVSDNGSGAYVPGTGIWTIGNLANGANAVLEITANVNALCNYDNTASVSANEDDTDLTNNTSTVTVTPTIPVSVTISHDAEPGNEICKNDEITFTASPTNGGSNPSYQWKLNGNDVGSNSPTYSNSTLNDGDIISVVLTSDLTCVVGSPSVPVTFFSWDDNTKPLTESDIGINAISINDGQYTTGGVGGTTCLAPILQNANIQLTFDGSEPDLNSPGIDYSIDYRRDESIGQIFTRGSSLIISGGSTFNVSYRVSDGASSFTTVTSSNFGIPNDATFHNYRFLYDPADGYGRLFVDGSEVWTSPTATIGLPMYWSGSGNIAIGVEIDASGRQTPTFDNLSLNSVTPQTAYDEIAITVNRFNLIVSPNGMAACPDLSPDTDPPFNPNNSTYNAGATELTFRITPDPTFSYNSGWSFDFAFAGVIVLTSGSSNVTVLTAAGDVSTPSKTGNETSGNVDAGNNNWVDLTFQVVNTPGSAQNISFSISNADDGDSCGETESLDDNDVTYTIQAMPVVGEFD